MTEGMKGVWVSELLYGRLRSEQLIGLYVSEK